MLIWERIQPKNVEVLLFITVLSISSRIAIFVVKTDALCFGLNIGRNIYMKSIQYLRKIWCVKDHLRYKLDRYRFLRSNLKTQFTSIFNEGGFGGSPSLSGAGSDMEQTMVVRSELPRIIQKYSIKSMLDVPCGDMYWLQSINLSTVDYIGADIVDELIKLNIMKFGESGKSKKNFLLLDMCKDKLPLVDLILCRDCLIHLKLSDAKLAIQNLKNSGSKWLLTTTYTSRNTNDEIGLNFFRPLNLQYPPFSFPKPVELINENCTLDDNKYQDKSLGLWRLSDIS